MNHFLHDRPHPTLSHPKGEGDLGKNKKAMGIVHGLSSIQFCQIIDVEVLGNIPFSYLYAISRPISFPSTLNNDGITYPNFTKKSTLRLSPV